MKLFKHRGAPLLVAALLFLGLNALAQPLLKGVRLDLTENGLYSLSEGTKRFLSELDEPLTLRIYRSERPLEDLPGFRVWTERVEELLEAYRLAASGKLRLEVLDPEPFSVTEDDAVRHGLQGVPTAGGDPLYFGLVATARDGTTRALPFLQPERERFLEYDISRLIHDALHPRKPVLGLLSGIDLSDGSSQDSFGQGADWLILEQLRQTMQLLSLDDSVKEIPRNIDVLMVVQPQRLPETALFALDQYLMGGGRALVFADPKVESENIGFNAPTEEGAETFQRMLKGWGMKPIDQVVADRTHAMQVTTGGPYRPRRIAYLPWLRLEGNALARQEILTSELPSLQLAAAGALEPLEKAETQFTPLLHSSKDAMGLDPQHLRFGGDPAALLARFRAENRSYVLAGRVEGPAKSAFEKVPEGLELPEEKAFLEKTGDLSVVLVADTDLLDDRFWVEVRNFFGNRMKIPTSGNGDFVLNAAELLAGGGDLIALRSRAGSERPFTLVEELRRKAEDRYLAKEQELVARLRQTEARINALQQQKEDQSSPILSPEQQAEIQRFRAEQLEIRQELREVQHGLRREIDELQTTVKAFNIAFMPGLLTMGAFLSYLVRKSRDRSVRRNR